MNVLHLGVDVGSTTVKLVVLGPAPSFECCFEHYQRHHFEVKEAVLAAFKALFEVVSARESDGSLPGELFVTATVTGSAGMQLAEILGLPFVQGIEILCSQMLTVFRGASVL